MLLAESLGHVAVPPVPVQEVFHISQYSGFLLRLKHFQRGKKRFSIPRDTSEKLNSKALLSASVLSESEQARKLEFCTILSVPTTSAEPTSFFQFDPRFYPAAGKDFLAKVCWYSDKLHENFFCRWNSVFQLLCHKIHCKNIISQKCILYWRLIGEFLQWNPRKDCIQHLGKAMRVFPSTYLPLSGSFSALMQRQFGGNPEIPGCSLKSPSHNRLSLLGMSQLNWQFISAKWLLNFSIVSAVPRAAPQILIALDRR